VDYAFLQADAANGGKSVTAPSTTRLLPDFDVDFDHSDDDSTDDDLHLIAPTQIRSGGNETRIARGWSLCQSLYDACCIM
jgi:hypothetical protein